MKAIYKSRWFCWPQYMGTGYYSVMINDRLYEFGNPWEAMRFANYWQARGKGDLNKADLEYIINRYVTNGKK